MKKLIAIVATVVLVVVVCFAASPVVTTKVAVWKWQPDPADLGGMTTNQYLTNIVFRLLRSEDCTTPTNLWPVITNWNASTFNAGDGNWTNYIAVNGNTAFYLLTVGAAGGNAPFSNLYVWVPTPPSGIFRQVGP